MLLQCEIVQQLDLRTISDSLDRQLPGTCSVRGWALESEHQNEEEMTSAPEETANTRKDRSGGDAGKRAGKVV